MKEQGTYPIIWLDLNIGGDESEKYYKSLQSIIIRAYFYHSYLG
jgi:hypothetical protein